MTNAANFENAATLFTLKGIIEALEAAVHNQGNASAVEAWANLYDNLAGKATTLAMAARDYAHTCLAGNDIEEEAELFDCVYGFALDEIARLGQRPTSPAPKTGSVSVGVDSQRLAALELTIEQVKNSTLPPIQRKKKLASLQQEVVALRGALNAKAA